MNLRPLNIKEFPKALPLKKLLGPSFILLGLGLGSGEVILWPFLASNFGLGIIWGAIIGITFQFFMNLEIERYALVNGESIFVGFARKLKWLPFWFIFSTFIPWIWPGIAASSAKKLSVENFKSIPGKGAQGRVDGKNIKVVSPGYLREQNIALSDPGLPFEIVVQAARLAGASTRVVRQLPALRR